MGIIAYRLAKHLKDIQIAFIQFIKIIEDGQNNMFSDFERVLILFYKTITQSIQRNADTFDLSANSPELNPTEKIWGIIVLRKLMFDDSLL